MHERGPSQPHRRGRLAHKDSGHLSRCLAQFFVRHDPAYEAQRCCFLGAKGAPGEQQLEGAMASHNARQMHEMNRRHEAEIDLGIAEGCAFAGQEHVAGDGEPAAATACCTT